MTVLYHGLASLVLLAHFAFVLFVGAGALLVLRWPRLAWLHVPAAIWGVAIELTGGICPLTPLENALRARAGLSHYTGDFLDRYVVGLLYPAGLTRSMQVTIGIGVVVLNLILYGLVLARRRASKRTTRPA